MTTGPAAAPTTGMVQTVLGPVDPADLGFTLTHEHVLADLRLGSRGPEDMARFLHGWEPPELRGGEPTTSRRGWWNSPITLENRAYAERDWIYFRNTTLNDVEHSAFEVARFRDIVGRGCIVDCTSFGFGRDPAGLRRISQETGVHIVMGSGFYIEPYHPRWLADTAEDGLVEWIVEEITGGVSGVMPGIIGEVGLTWPVHPDEAKSLVASVRAQNATGVPISIHPGLGVETPLDAAHRVINAGGDPSRVVIGHLDNRIWDDEDFVTLAKTGVWLELDVFGKEQSFYQTGPVDKPNDAQRLNRARAVADAGYADRLLFSHDIVNKSRTIRYGGFGFTHIPDNVVRLMRAKEFDEDLIEMITVENPARMLTIG